MAATITIPLGPDWALVYDAAASGDFTGCIGPAGSGDVEVVVTTGGLAPAAGDRGMYLPEAYGFTPIGLAKAYSARLYARVCAGSAALQLSKWLGSGIPAGAFEGVRALVTQGYTEANVKNGAQFEFSGARSTLPASGVTYSALVVGPKPILIKARTIQFTGKGVTARLFEGGTFTGGSPITIHNLRRENPLPCGATTFSGVTMSTLGTECGAPTVGIGSTGQGQTVFGGFAIQGVERWLKADTTYLLQITNDSATDPSDISVYVTFYEGVPDFPIPL